ncbi:hypothetical protein [Candidatus Magnetaquicoccus inordinatus]|uniref:hypothetical protein n=1 Tax=Candidatus Magnetaquicoccus inordinatus TaxID=2496818 RepID=UPI00102AD024|nr:hypothetical protein [Candidatus Magnetaquicoccus inordinatus]
MDKMVVLAGPSCVGKGPLYTALRRFYPQLASRFRQLVLFNDRPPRPGEEEGVHYFFRSRGAIEALRDKEGYVVADVLGDLQALEIAQIQRIIDSGRIPFFEGSPFVPGKLREVGIFDRFPTVSIFLSPLSREEILYLKDPERSVDLNRFITDIQRHKLLHRTQRHKGLLSLKDLENIEKRSNNALLEMRAAWQFDYVIPLHDGEGHENWDAFYYPIGSARKALMAFAALLQGEESPDSEKWNEELLL